MKNLKIELHLLQSFPPSCLNRDDTNTPKTCEFGGVNRARVSSQCWKRAIREYFQENAPERKGVRSKRLKAELIEALAELGAGDAASLGKPVTAFITAFYAGMDKKRPDETNVLVFWSQAEFAEMVAILSDEEILSGLSQEPPVIKKGDIEKRLKSAGQSADVALFARMLADSPGLNVDASCQVAHAISTHAVNLELDFFTAVDDLKDTDMADDAGAGMLGTVGYDSACYYRYTLLDVAQLTKNLHGTAEDALDSIRVYLRAFLEAVPSAKKFSFGHGVLPFFALAVVRKGGTPSSLVNAFAKPVSANTRRDEDLRTESAAALTKHAARLQECYDLYEGAEVFYFSDLDVEDGLSSLPGANVKKMKTLIENTVEATRNFAEEA